MAIFKRHQERLRARERADLAALADGSLPPERRAEVEARAEASPELRAALSEQRRAVESVRGAYARERAPEGLRAGATERAAGRTERGFPRRASALPRALLPVAAALAAVVVIAALVLPGGTPGGPGVGEAAELAERPPTDAAPAPAPGGLLRRTAAGVPFPNWAGPFGWRPSGARTDRLDGRAATTVFYDRGGRRIGYTIVAAPALAWPEDAARAVRRGVEYRSAREDGLTVLAWRRDGATCVLAGNGVSTRELLALAAWRGPGAVRRGDRDSGSARRGHGGSQGAVFPY
jgi:hypothetical protein